MRKTLAIILKDIRLRFASPVEWLFFLILPVSFIFILSGGTAPLEDNRLGLLTVEQVQSPLSQSLLAELEKSSSVRPIPTELQDALDQLSARQASSVLIIPAGFTSEALRVGTARLDLRQQKNNLNAMVQEQAVQTALGRVSGLVEIATESIAQAEAIRPFESDAARQAYFDQALQAAGEQMAAAPHRVVVVRGGTQDSIEYDPRANSTAGQMITWVFIPLIGLSAMFAMERAGGTLRRLLVTPTTRAHDLSGTILGQVLTAMLQMTILIVFGRLVMKINWGHDFLALGFVMVSSALAAASLGTMLGALIKSEAQANGLSIMVGMVMAMMGGCWYPIELFPQAIRNVAQILPTYWAMQGFLDIAVRSQGLPGVLRECAVLLGFATVLFTIGVARFRYE